MDPILEKTRNINRLVDIVEESKLSSPKGVILGIVDVIHNPHSNAKDLKTVIEVDPPLTARVLTVANSAYFGVSGNIKEIDQAVTWIGFDALKEIALSQKIWEIFRDGQDIGGYSRSLLWKHSLAVAMTGKMIYRREFSERGDDIYAAGLMHDIGIIVEDQFLPDQFHEIIGETISGKIDISKAERKILGYDHSEVGKSLAEHWDLPLELVEAVGYHHNPMTVRPEFNSLAKTLFIADCYAFEHHIGYGQVSDSYESYFSLFMDELKLSAYALIAIIRELKVELRKIEDKGLFET